jgi:radical SAM superfamily enzyme YgiQ (UPF0313 family)
MAETISRLGKEVRGRLADVTAAVSNFVPKPQTPFQWHAMQRREYFHYASYLQQFNDAFAAPFYRAQQVMQDLLSRAGHSPAEVASQGKALFALWVHRQASVSAFGDAFVFSAVLLTIGILPALLIRNRHQAVSGKAITTTE